MFSLFVSTKKRKTQKRKTQKRKPQKRKPQKSKTQKNVMIIKDHEIKGWRNKIREKNFNKILLRAYKKGIKTVIVKDDEYADKKYNVKNELIRRKLIKL